jgi:cytochrome c
MSTFLLAAAPTPVPKELPLELPLPEPVLVVVLIVSFVLHILFVNLMFGGTLLTVWAQIKGKKDPEYDILAHEIAKTITVNKSMAVVLGVAPLLSINVLYTIYFYSANSLIGLMWIAIIPLVTAAFLLTYLHKYTWKTLEKHKNLHISIIALAAVIFLIIPLIFLTNINLMLFPEKWGSIKGFLSALTLPNVFPRYFHFICASLSITGLFLFWYVKRKNYEFEETFQRFTRYDVQKIAYTLTLGASLAQFVIGPVVLITLPSKGMGWNLIATILTGVVFAVPAMYWMYRGLTGERELIAKNFNKVLLFFSLTVLFMISGRHLYRENSLAPHKQLMAMKRRQFDKASEYARLHPVKEETPAVSGEFAEGAGLFKTNCASCHRETEKLVGPPMTEMITIYGDNPGGFKKWVTAPGKKRPDYPQMPAFSGLSDLDLTALYNYIMSLKSAP